MGSDRGAGGGQRFKWLHGVSVVIRLAHIAAAGAMLVRLLPSPA